MRGCGALEEGDACDEGVDKTTFFDSSVNANPVVEIGIAPGATAAGRDSEDRDDDDDIDKELELP